MRKSLLGMITGAAVIAGGGLAAAQQHMDDSLGGASGAKGSSQRELGSAAHERQPGAMQGQAQGRSGAVEEKERRSGQTGEMQGQTQKRSGAVEERERRSGHPGAMQGQTQGRTGAVEERERRSGHPGAMQGQTQGRSGAIEEKEQRSGHPGAMQGQTQKRSGAIEEKERRSGQTGEMQGQNQKRTGAVEEKEHRSGHSGAMQGQAEGRSGAVEEKEQRSGHPGAMQGQTQGRSGTFEEHRSGQSGAVQGSAQGRSGGSMGSTALSSDQRTRLDETIASGNINRVDHVDFSLSLGTVVPDTATFYDVPERIVDIVPQYRGFKYIAVRDDFAIIDPGTREIVALVPIHGSVQGRSGRSVGSTTLSADQRTRLHSVITDGNVRRIDNADFALSVGTRVPNTVTFYDIPETIVDILPEYRGDEYIVVGDELVIIDPETLEILAVLPA